MQRGKFQKSKVKNKAFYMSKLVEYWGLDRLFPNEIAEEKLEYLS